jgi:hypothetical protein
MLFHLFYRWHGDLRAATKICGGSARRLFVCHRGPPLSRSLHDSANATIDGLS